MNAVALAYGAFLGGRDGAPQALKHSWDAVPAPQQVTGAVGLLDTYSGQQNGC